MIDYEDLCQSKNRWWRTSGNGNSAKDSVVVNAFALAWMFLMYALDFGFIASVVEGAEQRGGPLSQAVLSSKHLRNI